MTLYKITRIKKVKKMITRILFLSLFILFNRITAQDTHHHTNHTPDIDYGIVKLEIDGIKLSMTSNLNPMVVNKKIKFTVTTSDSMNLESYSFYLNILYSNENINVGKLSFKKQVNENKFTTEYTFLEKGKYNFELEIQNTDSLEINKTNKFSFSQEVKEINDDSDNNHNGMMGMGSSFMWIVMGAVMVVLMVVIGMNYH
ncbi:MAG: hypothetical protein L0Y79_00840 [Chlorobi bacterium]|nr:hypothetical protein [Chlorobiota bacterium]MCI0715506.1 hypothetical protein [Chlorobiota bacterium]